MLTPGMNNHGLGPVITADGKRFGHGGADEGFQANLTAYLDTGSGIAVMTNSDNGSFLADELMLSIAREYGWSGFTQIVKTTVQLPQEVYQRLAGHYKIEGSPGEFDLTLKGDHFVAEGKGSPDRELLPESENQFFVRDDGTPIVVSTEGGSTVLTIGGGLKAVKSPRQPN